jgi:hypothetical protein
MQGVEYGQPPPPGRYGQPPGRYGQPPGGNGRPPASRYGPPPPSHYARPGGYGQPHPGGNGQPPPGGNGQPPAGYGQPPDSNGQPPASYGQPPASNGQPPATYGQQRVTYGQQRVTYGVTADDGQFTPIIQPPSSSTHIELTTLEPRNHFPPINQTPTTGPIQLAPLLPPASPTYEDTAGSSGFTPINRPRPSPSRQPQPQRIPPFEYDQFGVPRTAAARVALINQGGYLQEPMVNPPTTAGM